ncbi:MAG: hypothetical protein LQ352_000059 [Teloschistes flavicans]|nr:MAG: hypothetical protein LQ352_000059 [Teloschistes flavicans]
MSGTNPFRRKDNLESGQPQPNGLDVASGPVGRAGIRFPPIDTGTAALQYHRTPILTIVGVSKSTKTKTVRIVSPHYSRSKDSQSISSITSPPPQSSTASSPGGFESPTSSEELSPVDPFSPQSDDATSADDDDDLRRNTIANANATGRDPPVILNAPTNPSRKAPALRFGGDAAATASREGGRVTAPQTGSRPRYDVNDFKRLLLTGEKLQSERAIASPQSGHIQGLQRGVTRDTSRPSVFDPLHQDSPQTSMDNEASDEERHALVQPSLSHAGRSRPSVPQSRHGKLVKQNTPQSVSFESLASSPPDSDSAFASTAKLSFPATPTGGTGLNKPLPPPPRSESPTPMAAPHDPNSLLTKSHESKAAMPHQLNPVAVKRSPPAVPTTRRHGQGRSRSSTNDSSRSASLFEELSQQMYPSPATSLSTTASRPPPLPPPRKAGAVPAHEMSSPTSSIEPGADFPDSTPSKSGPPPPPSRTASTSSVKRMSRIRTNSGSPGAAPPPPPRRRGSSLSQSSLAPSATFGEDRIISSEPQDNNPGPSSTQPRAGTNPDGKDLVADLAALQKEVDELRGRFNK